MIFETPAVLAERLALSEPGLYMLACALDLIGTAARGVPPKFSRAEAKRARRAIRRLGGPIPVHDADPFDLGTPALLPADVLDEAARAAGSED